MTVSEQYYEAGKLVDTEYDDGKGITIYDTYAVYECQICFALVRDQEAHTSAVHGATTSTPAED
jgi:hypothetical protein